MKPLFALFIVVCLLPLCLPAQPLIYASQVGYDAAYPKIAVIAVSIPLPANQVFTVADAESNKIVFTGQPGAAQTLDEWTPGKIYYRADFSDLKLPGKYILSVSVDGKAYSSNPFQIDENELAKLTLSSIIHYYHKQRANTPAELEADEHMHLIGAGDKTVDVHGGWCDASGDVSKYFSHLAYANFMSPQQTPLVVWSMESASEGIPQLLEQCQRLP
jgi:hypothetical protein